MLFFKRLGKRGTALTEYAVLLAFIAAVGVSFNASNGLADSIKLAIGHAEKVLGDVGDMPGSSDSSNSGGSEGGGNGSSGGSGTGGGTGSGDGGGTENPTDPPDPQEPIGPVDPVKPPETGGGNVGFVYKEDEEKYGQLVEDLIGYLFDTYEGEGRELTRAQINGNANGLILTYKDGQTQTINKIDIMTDLARKYKHDYDYDVKKATLNFENRKLVAGDGDTTAIEAWPSEKGQGQGSKKETLVLNEDGKLEVEK